MLFRIAPTPSGYLHLGNAVNFVLTWLAARQRGAKLLLRIDDLDAERKRPEYVDDIFRTLDWLGLDYDLGPASPDDFEAHWSQRHRLDRYADTLENLRTMGALYGCALSRREAGSTYPAGGRAQGLPLDMPGVAWRFRAEGDGSADFVVRRRDGLPAYQVASLTDDHDFGVTYLVRGHDLLESTDRQRQLASTLSWTNFLDARVWHHPLVLDKTGNKLSKSAGNGLATATSIKTLRESGSPKIVRDAVFRQVTQLLAVPRERDRSLAELLEASLFDNLFVPVQTVKQS